MPKNSSNPITPTFIPGQPERGNFYYWRMHPSSDASGAGRPPPCEHHDDDVNNPRDVIFGRRPSYENDLSMNQTDELSSSVDLAFLLKTIDAVIEVLSHSSDELGVVEPQQQ